MESSGAFSHQTQRIVFLIDLHPLLPLQNHNPYISTILFSSKTFLSFPPLSSSLFAFRFFFSSLSPLLSTSKVHRLLGKSAAFISFDSAAQTLASLSHTLTSLSSLFLSSDAVNDRTPLSRALLTARSLRQITHDYAWEPQIQDPTGNSHHNVFGFRSNLVVLFSPLGRSLKCVSEFMEADIDCGDAFCEKFSQVFGAVNEGFIRRDIHFCWVDVNSDGDRREETVGGSESGMLERGIKGLGWGFTSTDAIILGSAIVPFGLIYPYIGSSIVSRLGNDCCKVGCAELSLEILDVNGRPLECKCCDLELFDLKLSRGRCADLSWIMGSTNSSAESCHETRFFWRDGSDHALKIHVKGVWRGDVDEVKVKDSACDIVVLRCSSRESGKGQKKEKSRDFFADKVLKTLQREANEFTVRKPVWQLLLNFLYRERLWGLVSISDGAGSGNSALGILWPLTVHLSVLYIINEGTSPDYISFQFFKSVNGKNYQLSEANGDTDQPDAFTASQDGASTCAKGSGSADRKRKRNRWHSNFLQDVTWSSFCEAVLGSSFERAIDDVISEMNLEMVYFSGEFSYSKKLRFFKCWMKQIKKSSIYQRIKHNELKAQLDSKEEEERTIDLQQESELPIPSAPVIGDLLCGSVNDDTPAVSCSGNSEAFFESISQKIQQGLDSEEVDLGLLAERLVNLCIHYLHWKLERHSSENLRVEKLEDTHNGLMIASEVEKLLLRKPKDLAAKYKTSSLASNSSSAIYMSQNKVREHELQILFRMEMLQSKIGASIGEHVRLKMVKDICLILENIEFNLQGGMFGGESLVEFAGRTIKSRYAHLLEDVICKIYTQMEFVSFGDDNDDLEVSGSLPNSDNNNENQCKEENDIREIFDERNTMSAEDESPILLGSDMKSPYEITDEQDCRLMKAQERRERARRFASFTSWGPDLQRVWAPKQLRVGRAKKGSLQKPTEKRKWQRSRNDVVLETPMPEAKCGRQGDTSDGKCVNSSSCGSISKALFQNGGHATGSRIV